MEEQKNEKRKKEEKKPINKTLLAVNGVALIIILGVAGYFLYDHYFQKGPGGLSGGPAFAMEDADIEEICANWENMGEREGDRQPPQNGEMPERQQGNGSGFDQEKMKERSTLMEQICEDGEVSEDEKEQWENLEL
ncbi:MAG: hypothetical protein ABH835_02175 [Patescibacteria group bacterium]